MSRRHVWLGLLVLSAAVFALGGWLAWRFSGPVEVRLTWNINDLPFDVEVIPPVIQAKPGDMVTVIYRIRNRDIIPLEAFGRLDVLPEGAKDQVEIFLTQCGGLNTFQKSYAEDYEVTFRVQPAGMWGSQTIVLRHTFTRATVRR